MRLLLAFGVCGAWARSSSTLPTSTKLERAVLERRGGEGAWAAGDDVAGLFLRAPRAARRGLAVTGGALDVAAREAGELAGITADDGSPSELVVKTIVGAVKGTKDCVLGTKRRRHRAVEQLRGGSFDVEARETGEFSGLAEPSKDVVTTINSALRYTRALSPKRAKKAKAMAVRGGSLEFEARETGEFAGLVDATKQVKRTITVAFNATVGEASRMARKLPRGQGEKRKRP
ncbi:hypothetical protein M885DRAFT_531429 [Pelagophyceae sp. CCMP2097]|nr:hypothetical protein M885DRAFT_531429 [Pelagophyceae sp. CCMP2097]|mmetsp:Transcript_15974/g.55776  ORF Transcript_15974/g.55776 Transcript_15974/m.55776 type:complete len:232 (-) Transcript_15974:144-839(-)